MIEVDIVLRTGRTVTRYFSVLPREGEYIQLQIESAGMTRCKVQAVTHMPSTNQHTKSLIEIRL